MRKYLIVLLLLAIALPMIVIAGSSNVTAMVEPTATPTPTTVPSFFTCTFGVHIFPGADPMGTYTVNLPEGSVSGQYIGFGQSLQLNHIIVYLSNTNYPLEGSHNLLGSEMPRNLAVGSYVTTLDNGNYVISNVAFGHYYVYWSDNTEDAYYSNNPYGDEHYAGAVDLTAAAPHAVVDLYPQYG
jgi:hypothetical protein